MINAIVLNHRIKISIDLLEQSIPFLHEDEVYLLKLLFWQYAELLCGQNVKFFFNVHINYYLNFIFTDFNKL